MGVRAAQVVQRKYEMIGFGYANYYATKISNGSAGDLAWTVVVVVVVVVVAFLETAFYLHKLFLATPLDLILTTQS